MKIFEMDEIAVPQSKERALDDFLFYAGDIHFFKLLFLNF